MDKNLDKKYVRRPKIRFNESEIKLAFSVMEQLKKPLELMYYFMEQESEKSFVIIFLSAKGIDVDSIVKLEKRDTDLWYILDKGSNLYALLCQETKVDGAYRFAERLLDNMTRNNATDIYCSELEILSTKYPIEEVIFKSIENYNKLKQDKKENEIVFHSLA